MTIAEALSSEKTMLTAQEAAPLLGMHPQAINLKAKEGSLPFPYMRSGNRTKIPRLPLLRWLGLLSDHGGIQR